MSRPMPRSSGNPYADVVAPGSGPGNFGGRPRFSHGNQFQEERAQIMRDRMSMSNNSRDPYRQDSMMRPLGIQPGMIPQQFGMPPERKRKAPDPEFDLGPGHISFKNMLNEWLMKQRKDMPTYSHQYVAGLGFMAQVYFDDKEYSGIAYQKSKKDAEQDACHNALFLLGLVAVPPDPNENLNKKLREEGKSLNPILVGLFHVR